MTPRRTLASPRLTHLHHHPRIDHLHHHPSSLRRPPLLVLPLILRTRCSLSLSFLTHSGMRPRSTESSSLRIWRRWVLTCTQFWPIRPSFYSSSRLCRTSSRSSWLFTILHHLHRSDLQGSTLTLYVFILPVGTLDLLFGGGGYFVRVLYFYVLFIAVLVSWFWF